MYDMDMGKQLISRSKQLISKKPEKKEPISTELKDVSVDEMKSFAKKFSTEEWLILCENPNFVKNVDCNLIYCQELSSKILLTHKKYKISSFVK
jgi:hypothetical protein